MYKVKVDNITNYESFLWLTKTHKWELQRSKEI